MPLVAIDSNALTYLVDAVEDGYLPRDDVSGPDPERVAMFRLFCYTEASLWVGPAVKHESSRIEDSWRRNRHEVWAGYHLEDFNPRASEEELERRARELFALHPRTKDCRVVAEAESVEALVLLTFDRDLTNHLQAHARLKLLAPSKFLETLGIAPGSVPRWEPRYDNPLSRERWWRI